MFYSFSMKKIIFIIVAMFMCSAHANEGDDNAIRACLAKWDKSPFSSKNPKFRTISTKVKVMGIGGDVQDNEKTEKPELILVKPGVSVMTKALYNLNNPNGWYCLKGSVSVLGKTEINIHCKAQLASSKDDLSVMGASDAKTGGISVLGSVRIKRACD